MHLGNNYFSEVLQTTEHNDRDRKTTDCVMLFTTQTKTSKVPEVTDFERSVAEHQGC